MWLVSTDYAHLFPQIDQIVDPVVESTYNDIWMARAKVTRRNKMLIYINNFYE